MKYGIIYMRDSYPYHYKIMKTCRTLQEAKLLRAVSGDLVIDLKTRKIVVDYDWLWDWEFGGSYALGKIEQAFNGFDCMKNATEAHW